MGLVGRRGRRGRPPKLSVTTEQQAQRRRDRLQEVRGQKCTIQEPRNGVKAEKSEVLRCLRNESLLFSAGGAM